MSTKFLGRQSGSDLELKKTSLFNSFGGQNSFDSFQPNLGFEQQQMQQPVDLIKVSHSQESHAGSIKSLEPYGVELTIPALCADTQRLSAFLSDKYVQALPQLSFAQLVNKVYHAIIVHYNLLTNLAGKTSRPYKSFEEYVKTATNGHLLGSTTHFVNETAKILGGVYCLFLKDLAWLENDTVWNALVASASITSGVYTRSFNDHKAIFGIMAQHAHSVNSINMLFIEYVFELLSCLFKIENGYAGAIVNTGKGNDPDFAEISNLLSKISTISLFSISRGESSAKIARGPTGAKDALILIEESLRSVVNKLKSIKKGWTSENLLESLGYPTQLIPEMKQAKNIPLPTLVKDQYSDSSEITWSQDTTTSTYLEAANALIVLSIFRNYAVPEKINFNEMKDPPRFAYLLQAPRYNNYGGQYQAAPRGQYSGFGGNQMSQGYKQPMFGGQGLPTFRI